MINIYGYKKALRQLEESNSQGMGFAVLKKEGDWVYPEEVVRKYISYRNSLKRLKDRKLP